MYTAAAAVGGDRADLHDQLLQQLQPLRRRRARARWTAPRSSNLGPGYRFHYLPQAPENAQVQPRHRRVREHRLRLPGRLPAGARRRHAGAGLRPRDRWSAPGPSACCRGYWTHAGYLNWDTGLGFKRWHQGKKLGLSAGRAARDRDVPGARRRTSPWAKHMLDRSFELFDRWTERRTRRCRRRTRSTCRRSTTTSPRALLAAARVQANAAQAALLGARRAAALRGAAAAVRLRPRRRPPRRHHARLQHGDRRRQRAARSPTAASSWRGCSTADQDVAGGVGGRPPASFGVVVRSRRDDRRRLPARARAVDDAPLRLLEAPRGATANPQSYPNRPYAGAFETLRVQGSSTRGGIGIRTTHTFKADYIETEWRVTGAARQAGRGPVPELGRGRPGHGGHEVRGAQAGLQRDGALQRRPLPRRERALGLRRDVALRRVRRDRAGTAAERAVLGAEARADADRAGEGDDGRGADRAGQERG